MGSRSSAILPCLKPKPPPDPSARHQNSAIAPPKVTLTVAAPDRPTRPRLYCLCYLLQPHVRGTHDRVKQAMTGDGRIKAGAGRLAVADAIGQFHIELGDIVGRPRRHPFR